MNKSKRIAISLVMGVLAALLCMVYGSSIRSQAEQVQAETLAKYGGDRVEVCVAARDTLTMWARPSMRPMSLTGVAGGLLPRVTRRPSCARCAAT